MEFYGKSVFLTEKPLMLEVTRKKATLRYGESTEQERRVVEKVQNDMEKVQNDMEKVQLTKCFLTTTL